MKTRWTIVGVRDVVASFSWYQRLLGLSASAPGHSHFGQIMDADGTVLLCLHEWGARPRRPVRRRASREPEHPDERVLAPRSRRLLRHDQRIVGGEAMKFEWQRLHAEYAAQFGIEKPNNPTR